MTSILNNIKNLIKKIIQNKQMNKMTEGIEKQINLSNKNEHIKPATNVPTNKNIQWNKKKILLHRILQILKII